MKSTETRPSITELEERIAELPPDARAAAERIFTVSTTTGRLDPPPQMREWIIKQFGSVDAVTTQRIVRVTNLVMMEGALFNDVRARRPAEVKGASHLPTACTWKPCSPGGSSVNLAEIFTPSGVSTSVAPPTFVPRASFSSARAVAASTTGTTQNQHIATTAASPARGRIR